MSSGAFDPGRYSTGLPGLMRQMRITIFQRITKLGCGNFKPNSQKMGQVSFLILLQDFRFFHAVQPGVTHRYQEETERTGMRQGRQTE